MHVKCYDCDTILTELVGESLKINFLSPYLESSGSHFSHGVNFAVTGASTQGSSNNPFTLTIQALQFGHFQNRTRDLRPQGLRYPLFQESRLGHLDTFNRHKRKYI